MFLEKLENFLSNVRERPSHERKTMLVATFLATSALVFSFWANHMYNQFGLAFNKRHNSASSQEYALPAESSMENAPENNNLESPLATLWENIGLIKEEAIGLADEIRSAFIDAAALTQVITDDGKKEFPMAQEGQAEQSEPVKISTKSERPVVLGAGDKEPPLVSMQETGAEDIPPLPEKKYAAEIQRKPGSMIEVDPSSETALVVTSLSKPTREVKRDGLVSIFKYNFATIKQGMINFYEYIIQ